MNNVPQFFAKSQKPTTKKIEINSSCATLHYLVHYKDLTETGNRARKVSGIQGTLFTEQILFYYLQPTIFS